MQNVGRLQASVYSKLLTPLRLLAVAVILYGAYVIWTADKFDPSRLQARAALSNAPIRRAPRACSIRVRALFILAGWKDGWIISCVAFL